MAQNLLGLEMLAKIIDGSSIPVLVINREHKVIFWNTALEALCGVEREKVIGTDGHWRAFYSEKRPVMADLIVEGALFHEIERYYSNKDCQKSPLIEGAFEAEDFFPDMTGNGKWLHFTASPIKDDSGEIIGAIETIEDITERKSAEDNLRFYLQEITRAQEQERKRIARELHDDTTQVLASLSRQLDNFLRKKHGLSDEDVIFLRDLQSQLNVGMESIHRFIQNLRPSLLDDLGLIPALRSLLKNLSEYEGVATDLQVFGEERRFSPEAESLVFRIVQEAINNIWKHSSATETRIVAEFADTIIRLSIVDNGRGFKLSDTIDNLPRSGKLGLAGMQERARLLGGSVEILSTPGEGTTVIIEVPN